MPERPEGCFNKRPEGRIMCQKSCVSLLHEFLLDVRAAPKAFCSLRLREVLGFPATPRPSLPCLGR